MNVLTKIESDHQEIRNLIKQVNVNLENLTIRGEKFEMLKSLVLIHHNAEQETLLNELVQHDSSREKAMHLVEEHGEHKKIIEQMDALSSNRRDWRERYKELQHDLLHHIEEEENELFELSRESLDTKTLHKIGNEMVLATAISN